MRIVLGAVRFSWASGLMLSHDLEGLAYGSEFSYQYGLSIVFCLCFTPRRCESIVLSLAGCSSRARTLDSHPSRSHTDR